LQKSANWNTYSLLVRQCNFYTVTFLGYYYLDIRKKKRYTKVAVISCKTKRI